MENFPAYSKETINNYEYRELNTPDDLIGALGEPTGYGIIINRHAYRRIMRGAKFGVTNIVLKNFLDVETARQNVARGKFATLLGNDIYCEAMLPSTQRFVKAKIGYHVLARRAG